MQNNIGNLKSPNTIVAPITHDLPTLPRMVPIEEKKDGSGNTILNGCVNTSNIVCVNKARLGDYIDVLSPREIRACSKFQEQADFEQALKN